MQVGNPRWWVRPWLTQFYVVVPLLVVLGTGGVFACPSESDLGTDAIGVDASLGQIYHGDSVALEYQEKALVSPVALATRLWSKCEQYAVGFPRFVDRGLAERVLHLELRKTSPDRRCGSFAGTRIVLYRFSRRSSGAFQSCGSLGQNLAHEMGHALGLADMTQTVRGRDSIMSRLHPLNRFSREVHEDECSGVDLRWLTRAEGARPASDPMLPLGIGQDR